MKSHTTSLRWKSVVGTARCVASDRCAQSGCRRTSTATGCAGATSCPGIGPAGCSPYTICRWDRSPVALPAVATSPPVPGRLVAIGSIPSGFEPGGCPVGTAFSGFSSAKEGMRLLGRPMGDAAGNGPGGIDVQYFEKGRLECNPEEPSQEWQSLLGLLASGLIGRGVELPVGGDASSMTDADLARLRVAGLRIPPPDGFGGGFALLDDGSVFVPSGASLAPGAGHVVPPLFWAFLNATTVFPGGWLHDVGPPLTPVAEVIVSKGPETGRRILVQAFQRTILTFDPLNPSDYQVECANVGTDYVRSGGVDGSAGG